MSIYPPLIESVAKPGKSMLIAYTVANEGDPLILSTGISTFVPNGIEGNVTVLDSLDGPIRFNLENADIALGKSFLIRSNEKKQLLLKIRVPEGTPEGDYYYTFYVKTDSSNIIGSDTNTQAQLTLGAHIILSVTNSGRLDIKGSILKFALEPDFHFSFLGKDWNIVESTSPIPIDLVVHNDGQNVFKSDGSISVKGPMGNTQKFSLNQQNIIVNASRIIEASQEASFSCANGKKSDICAQKHSLILSGLFIGNHIITTNVTFGTSTKTAEISFIGIPLKFLLATISTIVMILISVRIMKKNEPTSQ